MESVDEKSVASGSCVPESCRLVQDRDALLANYLFRAFHRTEISLSVGWNGCARYGAEASAFGLCPMSHLSQDPRGEALKELLP